MADLIEIGIVVREKGLKESLSTVSRLERQIMAASKAIEKGTITQDRYNKVLLSAKREYQALGVSSQRATGVVRKFANEQRRLAQEASRVSQSLRVASQGSVRYAAAAGSASDATNRTRQAFLNTANSIAIMDGPLGGVASRFSAFGVLIGRTGILLGSLAVTLSSLGLVFAKGFRDLVQYEVQMAKIEGVLKTTGNQAGLTARDIEIMSSRIAMATLESEDAVRSAATQLLTFKNVGKDVFETTLKAATDMAALGFGTVESEAVKLAKALEDPRQSLTSLSRSGITFTRQQRQLITSLVESGRQAEAMDRILANVNRQVGGAGEAAARNTMAGAFDTIGQAVRLATRNFAESIVEVTGLDRAISALAATAGRFVEADNITLEDQIKAAREQVALLGPELEAALTRESDSTFSSAFLKRGQRGSTIIQHELDLANQLLEVTTNRLEEEGRISAVTQARTQMQQRSNALDNLQAEAEAIRENIGLTEQQIRVNKALAAEGLLGIDISKEMDEYIASLRAAQTPQAELVRRAEDFYQVLIDSVGVGRELAEALDLAELGRQFVNNSKSIEDQNDLLVSQLALMDAGISASEARRQAELNLQLEQANTLKLAEKITEQDYEQLRVAILKNQALSADLANRTAAPPRTGGGSTREPVRMSDAVGSMLKEISNQKVLLGLYGQEQRTQEILFDLKKKNEAADIKMTKTALENAARRIEENERANDVLREARQVQEDLANIIDTSMENAFMSMVDGTKSVKDAFKNMAREIIAELYKVLFVQRLVGSAEVGTGIAGAISNMFADGAAFSGGNVVPFANGGVVGGPTHFAMSGGRTGLMGEAGPEAIMPLKRGSDGKLGVSVEGGSGSVVVNNNINVTGGSDPAAIRMEVAKLMPQITNATKTAVIDARRRGGQMKAAFG